MLAAQCSDNRIEKSEILLSKNNSFLEKFFFCLALHNCFEKNSGNVVNLDFLKEIDVNFQYFSDFRVQHSFLLHMFDVGVRYIKITTLMAFEFYIVVTSDK